MGGRERDIIGDVISFQFNFRLRGVGKTAAVTHFCLLVRDHTVKEVIVLEQKTDFSGQIIRAIMQGQGFIVCWSEAHGGGRALLLLFG